MSPASQRTRRPKGERRRQQVIRAAADLIVEQGPYAVTHRAVAARAGASLSATTYYFKDLEELLDAASEVLVEGWVAQVADLHERLDSLAAQDSLDPAAVLVDAVIPANDDDGVRRFYETMAATGRSQTVGHALAEARPQLDEAVSVLVGRLIPDAHLSGQAVVALVNGAALRALGEGRDPREQARELLRSVIDQQVSHFARQ